jgi:lipopolysaccharide transport system permease protein
MRVSRTLNNLKSFLGLSFALAKAEFKLRNEGSYLGVFWYLLGPVLMFCLLLAVFSTRLGNDIPSYPLYLLLGVILFNFFQYVTTESTRSVSLHKGVIKSIKFDLETIVSATTLKALFSHIFEIVILAIVMLIFGVSLKGLLFYPLILFVFCIFLFGASLILASLTVYFTDLENIWVFVSRLLWLATPIFYAIGGQDRLLALNMLNPLYYFITVSRDVIVYGKMPEIWLIGGMLAFSLASLLIGFLIFRKLKRKFAELI